MPRKPPVWFHHAIPFCRLQYGIITPKREYSNDEWFIRAYDWLHSEVGFYPLFMAVGHPNDVAMTGYQNNWRRFMGTDIHKKPNGEVEFKKIYSTNDPLTQNLVLFSFRNVDGGFFTEYGAWHCALGAYGDQPQHPLTAQERSWIFKKSWSRAKWLRHARKNWHSVQLVVPQLDLRNACRVWVKNQVQKKAVEAMGWQNVRVKRIPVHSG